MGILLFFVIFGVVVIVHELGHFLLAKANGIGVVEFSIGMGPCIFHFDKNGTRYAIRLFPIGGACMFEGEDGKNYDLEELAEQDKDGDAAVEGASDEESMPSDTNIMEEILVAEKMKQSAFPNATVGARFATVFAGPFFNFVLAFLFSMIIVASVGVDLPKIYQVSEDGGAKAAGLMAGDEIVSLNGEKTHLYRDISLFSMLYEGGNVEVVYKRDGKLCTTVITPEYDKSAGRYYLGLIGTSGYTKLSFSGVIKYSYYETLYWVKSTMKSLALMVRGKVKKEDVSGPVGMAQAVNTIYTESKPDGVFYIWLNMLNFAVLLSANLGVLNLLPLPALDGGRIVFLLVEMIRRKPVPAEKEGFVHMIGFVLLMLLMIFVFFNDITKLF